MLKGFLLAGAAIVVGAGAVVADSSMREVQAQQHLRLGVVELPPSRGNPYGGSGTPGIFTWSMFYDGLTFVDTKGVPGPALGATWRNVDPATWEFKLKPGIKFDNGEAFDAQAVADAVNWLLSEQGKAQVVAREVTNFASARAVDATTTEFKTKTPDAILPSRMANIFIVAPKAWKDAGMEGYANKPVGTGSYRVEAWAAEKVTLAARADSWRPAKIGRVEATSLPERPSRTQALLSNQLDIAIGMDTEDIIRIRSAGAEVAVAPAPQVISLSMPNKVKPNSPFNDKRVRQAANFAVNKKAIVDGLFQGQAQVATQGATPTAFGYNPNVKGYPFDPDRARRLLAEAGHPNGFKTIAEVVVGSFAGDSEMYQLMAQDLSKVGIQVELRPVRFPDWLRKYQNNSWEGDTFGLSWQLAPYMDVIRAVAYYSCAQRPAVFFCDEDTQKIIDASNSELDRAKREKLLHQVQERYFDLAPALWLVEAIDVYGLNKRVRNFKDVNRTLLYHEMTLGG
jgi:peptide/nickel transport system substrate-binding protein